MLYWLMNFMSFYELTISKLFSIDFSIDFYFFLNITKNYIIIIFIPLKNKVFWYFVVFINGKMNLSLRLFNVKYSLQSIL